MCPILNTFAGEISHMSDDLQDYWSTRAGIALFAVIALLIGWDVITDYREGANFGHMAIELFVLLVAASGAVLLWRQLHRTRSDLVHALVETEQWRRENHELILGLGVAIKKQFDTWQLTKAESEVGLFLLKGLSHKEIAEVRQTSERTIREQARAVYRKSNLSGRPALSAFFLEDLLLPWTGGVGERE
jgi:DNA-binding CsgD family transcriptional regulator